jgi:hypothetical protein
MILIGIDPDVDKSGIAVYNTITKQAVVFSMSFFDLYEFLKTEKSDLIKIEAGWLNKKSNWHNSYYSKKAGCIVNNNSSVNQKIAQRVGANHEVGRKIASMCDHLEKKYELVIPRKSKTNSAFFKKLTGIKKSTQDERDACMLVFGY